MRRTLLILMLLLLGAAFSPAVSQVEACPMCKAATESDEENRVPQAYMYSILFMISMPAVILSGFAFLFYRAVRNQRLQDEAAGYVFDEDLGGYRSPSPGELNPGATA